VSLKQQSLLFHGLMKGVLTVQKAKRGVVMQVHDGRAMIMTPDHRYLEIKANPTTQVGAELTWQSERDLLGVRARSWKRAGGMVASVALIAALAATWSISKPDSAQAAVYVSVDINPSVELGLDEHARVISAKPLDADGTLLLSKLHTVGLPLDQAVRLITDTAVKAGYIHASDVVLVSVAPVNGSVPKDLVSSAETEAITNAKRAIVSDKLQAIVEGMMASSDLLKKAQNAGLSPGKYALWLQTQVNGVPLTQHDVKGQTVSSLLRAHKSLASFIKQNQKSSDLDGLYAKFQAEHPVNNADGSITSDHPTDAAQKRANKLAHGDTGVGKAKVSSPTVVQDRGSVRNQSDNQSNLVDKGAKKKSDNVDKNVHAYQITGHGRRVNGSEDGVDGINRKQDDSEYKKGRDGMQGEKEGEKQNKQDSSQQDGNKGNDQRNH